MAQNQKQSVQPKQLQRNQAHIASTSSGQSASTSQQPLNGDLVTPSELDDLNGELNFDEKALLYSDERLDRTSPELWPEQIPGVTEFLAQNSPPLFENQSPPEWLKDLGRSFRINLLYLFTHFHIFLNMKYILYLLNFFNSQQTKMTSTCYTVSEV